MVVVFSPLSETERNCDFVRFYKSTSYDEYWGEDKYSGEGADRNFPGIGKNPPLYIPAKKIFLNFTSDASVNKWGYKAVAYASDDPSEKVTEKIDMITVESKTGGINWLDKNLVLVCRSDLPYSIYGLLSLPKESPGSDEFKEVDNAQTLEAFVSIEKESSRLRSCWKEVKIPHATQIAVYFDITVTNVAGRGYVAITNRTKDKRYGDK
ncbi:unnamed protein product [Sphagnum balticum]